ncbi:MAG: GWxTD domain-containing protein [candidate division KSB1 bacterium]|nr:GWxTD domain-containing protein [candidate division KSB1 bacterium]
MAAINVLGVAAVDAKQPGHKTDKKLAAQQLFQETLSLRNVLPLEEYITRLERVIRLNNKFAEAFHELGQACIERGTIEGRNRAFTALERAIQLAPRNAEYHYSLARLHLKRNAPGSAASEFRKMMKINPADARPYYHLALFKEESMLTYRDMVSVKEDALIYFYDYAEKDYAEAERLLRVAIVLDPMMAEAYHRLAALYYEAGRYQEMAEVLETGLSYQTSSDLFLFLGLARQQLGKIDEAMAAYQHALQLMSSADRELFYSLQPVLSPDSSRAYANASDSLRARMQRRFWKVRDPLFLTDANERLIEHFGRMAYANLRFSFPEKNIEGWKTDRGKTLIRFGNPRSHVRTTADLVTSPTGRLMLNPRREIWDYGDFYITFDDRFMNNNYTFAWGDFAETDGKWIFEHKIRTEPERYRFPHGGKRLSLPHIIAQYRGAGDSAGTKSLDTRLEIYFGLPDSSLQEIDSGADTRPGRRFALRRGLFFFDENWDALRQWQEDRDLFYPFAVTTSSASTGGHNPPSTGNKYLLDCWQVHMPPGRYYLSLEVMDKKSGHSGAEREPVVVEDFTGEQLNMSSIVLGHPLANDSDMSAVRVELPLDTKDITGFVPSLFREFTANTPIHINYEVYNLALDMNGQSHYRIEYVIEPLPAGKSFVNRAVSSIGRLLGLEERSGAITYSFESTGDSRTERIYHSLDIQGEQTSWYHLTIRVADRVSGQSLSRRVAFVIRSEFKDKG